MTGLSGVRIKIDRAKHHLNGLEREVTAYLASQPYTGFIDTDPHTGDQLYRVRINTPIPTHWSGPVGDIVHNLRSALDQLAVALVVLNGHTSKTAINETYFPIGADEKSFSTKKINRAHPTAIRMVERLKPYKGGITDFWRLHQMDILDKHSLLIPVGAANVGVGFRMRVRLPGTDEDIVSPMINLKPADTLYPLEDGATVFIQRTGSGPAPQPGDVQATFIIAFGEGQIVDGQPVIPVLKQFVDFIERVVLIFQKRFFP